MLQKFDTEAMPVPSSMPLFLTRARVIPHHKPERNRTEKSRYRECPYSCGPEMWHLVLALVNRTCSMHHEMRLQKS